LEQVGPNIHNGPKPGNNRRQYFFYWQQSVQGYTTLTILDAAQARLELCYAGHQPSDVEYFHQELVSHFSSKRHVLLHETNTFHLQEPLLTNQYH